MKKNIYIVFAISLLIGSCTDKFDEINTNPVELTTGDINDSNIGKLFSQTQYAAMQHSPIGTGPWIFQVAQALFSDLYAQYFATTQPRFDSDRNVMVGNWTVWTWRGIYEYTTPQLFFVDEYTEENNLSLEGAINKVWKVQTFHRLTDAFGPIPMSEVGNDAAVIGYDSQESVYTQMFTLLDEAIAELKNHAGRTSTIFGADDLMYSGNADQWLKFANSLKLRLAMRTRFVDPSGAQTRAEQAISDGVIDNNGDNADLLTFAGSPNAYNVISAWGEYRMSAAMESTLKGYDDPRMPQYFSPAAGGDSDGDGIPYEGIRNGQSRADLENTVLNFNQNASDMAPVFLEQGVAGPSIKVLHASEVYFIRAEGALIGWNMGGGSAQSYYEAGIDASLDSWGVADAAFKSSTNVPATVGDTHGTPALSDIPVAFETTASQERQLEQIMTQKWLALFPDSWEAWSELRRTGYPVLYDRLNSDNPAVPADEIMRRLEFVSLEYDTNAEAVDAALRSSEIGGNDSGHIKLWWDKK